MMTSQRINWKKLGRQKILAGTADGRPNRRWKRKKESYYSTYFCSQRIKQGGSGELTKTPGKGEKATETKAGMA